MERTAQIQRTTKETDIQISLNLDGKGQASIQSGNGFMDHMLTLFTRHGLFDLNVNCKGDTIIDFHHSIEDIGISLGLAFSKALGDCKGITRYATEYVPMDEALARVSIDIAGRPNLVYEALLPNGTENFDADLMIDFLKAFTDNARITCHVDLIRGRNGHHCLEAIFKALGRSLCKAVEINKRSENEIPSTKGVL